jgi:Domain of unknown function (DUF4395)
MSIATSRIDARGPRFAAAVTTVVLAAAVLAAPSPTGTTVLALQTLAFLVGATAGPQHTPYAWLFRRLVRPRLGPPTELEDVAPPRFAQGVGLVFAMVALGGYLAGATVLGAVAAGLALAAAFLNAAFGLCLGCEAYLLLRRAGVRRRPRPAGATSSTTAAAPTATVTSVIVKPDNHAGTPVTN